MGYKVKSLPTCMNPRNERGVRRGGAAKIKIFKTILREFAPQFCHGDFLGDDHHVQTKGECASKEEAPIIVSNHVSPFEPFYLVAKTMATPVQRIEDSRAPIVGTIQKAMQVWCTLKFFHIIFFLFFCGHRSKSLAGVMQFFCWNLLLF